MFGHEAAGVGLDTSSVHEAATGADPWCPEHLDTFLNSLNSGPGAPASVQPPSVPAEVHKTDPGLLPSADPVLTPSSPRGDGEPPPGVPGAQPDLAPPCSLVQQPRVDNSARCRQYRQRARARRADLERELHQLSTRNVHLQMKHQQQKAKVEKLRKMIKTYLGPDTPKSGLMETIVLELLGL